MQSKLRIKGYENIELLHEGINTIIYRSVSISQQEQVILKVLKPEYPSLEQVMRIKHEYSMTCNLHLRGVVKLLRLDNFDKRLILVFEDFGGVSLKEYLQKDYHSQDDSPVKSIPPKIALEEDLIQKGLDIKTFLHIAIELTKALVSIHSHQIIHKDIKPSNIIINPQTKQCKLTDFSIASLMKKETVETKNVTQLEGTLKYISPEQTGRMNRIVDYRSDFYSLGITFYEILSGDLPFNSNDPLELLHCHIAKKPLELLTIEKGGKVPKIINDIIIKLIAKNAEDRYQSAEGLLADLELCLREYQENGTISPFPIGEQDISSQLLMSEKLYGREEEVKLLLSTLGRVGNPENKNGKFIEPRSEIIVVSGYSGTGKSSLISELNKPIVEKNGYFIKGKCDQLGRNTPYGSILQAFKYLIQQLLTQNPERLNLLKEKILKALGSNGKIIIDVLPELELIIGKQPSVAQLSAIESQIRFNRIFQKFVEVFCQPEHPLVLFLDDLQWVDGASLNLLQLLMSNPDSKYLLLIAAYRDNEVSSTHPLIRTLTEIEQSGVRINNIVLEPLKLIHVKQFVRDTLNFKDECKSLQGLAELLFNKTQGNPFFLKQLLKALHQEKLLKFDFTPISSSPQTQIKGWEWNIKDILAAEIVDKNILDLMARSIQTLPEDTQIILNLAACIGAIFSLDILEIISERSLYDVAKSLKFALRQGLVVPLNFDYKVPVLFTDRELNKFAFDNSKILYKFLHDRVQQAAYSLIPESQKQKTHLKIGQLLLKSTPKEALEDNIFDIVDQLNFGIGKITQPNRILELARLNSIAGYKAKSSAAYENALDYYSTGISLLDKQSWIEEYQLTLELYQEAAEIAYLISEFELMQKWIAQVIENATSLLDKVKAYEILIQAYISQKKFDKGIQVALKILQEFHIYLPEKPSKYQFLLGLGKTKLNLIGKKPSNLVKISDIADKNNQAVMKLLSSSLSAAYLGRPELFPLLVFKQVNLSISSGNTALSSFSYAWYGLILCGILGDINNGYEFGKLALKVYEKFNVKSMQSKVIFIVNGFINHWKIHVGKTLKSLLQAYNIGMDNGDIEYAFWSATVYSFSQFFAGEELEIVESQMSSFLQIVNQYKLKNPFVYISIYHQAVLNLLGRNSNPSELQGSSYDYSQQISQEVSDNGVLKTSVSNGAGLFFSSCEQMKLFYLFGQYTQAVEVSEVCRKYLSSVTGLSVVGQFYFYDSLAKLAICDRTNNLRSKYTKNKRILKQVNKNQQKIKKWSKYAPENYLHKYYLIKAEKYSIIGKFHKAAEYYDKAIDKALANRYIQEQALALERAAIFYLSFGKEKIAKTYMTDAYYNYMKWGAIAKLEELENKYPHLIIHSVETQDLYLEPYSRNNKRSTSTISHNSALKFINETHSFTKSQTSRSSNIEIIDFASIIKASESIQSETDLNKLPLKLLHIILENAGAYKGCLIIERDGNFFVEAIDVDESIATDIRLSSTPLNEFPGIPQKVINYVINNQHELIIKDAINDSVYQEEEYIQKNQCKSICCLPIVSRDEMIGLIYLENNFTSNIFTSSKLEILKVLASQAGTAIRNARLFTSEKEKSQQLEKSLAQLQQKQIEIVQKEEQYRSVFESVSDGLLILDLQTGKAVAANPQFAQMNGYSIEEFMSLDIQKVVHPDSLMLFDDFMKTVSNGKDFWCEAVNIRKDGSIFDIEVKATPFMYDGKIHSLSILRDITKEKQAKKALQNSQDRLEKMFEYSADAILLFDPEKVIFTDCNQSAVDLMGFSSKEELIGKSPFDISPETQPEGISSIDKATGAIALTSEKGSHRFEWSCIHSDGNLINLEVVLTQIPFNEKSLFQCIWRDVTERKEAEVALRQSEDRLKKMFEYSADAVLLYDPHDIKFTDCNQSAVDLMGFSSREELIGKSPLNISPEFQPDGALSLEKAKYVTNLSYEKGSHRFEWLHINVRGEEVLVEIVLTLIPFNEKPIFQCVWRDITERKKAEIALQKSEQQLKLRQKELERILLKLQSTQSQLVQTEKISQLGQLVAGVAHEVNNPVSFISGNLFHAENYIEDIFNLLNLYQEKFPQPGKTIDKVAEEIDLEYLLEDLPKMISSMKLGADRIKDIMQSLRNYSRTNTDEKKSVDLHQGINTTLMILSHRLKANKERPAIQIIKNYGDLPLVECYHGQINQVFMNLIANAIDALDESNQGKSYGEIEKHPNIITISTNLDNTDTDNKVVKIGIADNGTGIPEPVKQKLFEAFFTTKPEGKGTGLGLSISYEIITEKHNGTLECLSSPGEGTEFFISLPI